jgi:hypothetical protein
MAEAALRLGTHVLLIALVLVIGWIMRQFYSSAQVSTVTSQSEAALAAALPTPTPARGVA